MGLNNVHWLHAVTHCNHNVNSNFDYLLWNPWFNRSYSDVFGNCSSCPWYFTSETKNAEQMARQTCKNSLPNMVVCFPFRRNCLPVIVRLLERFRGKGSIA